MSKVVISGISVSLFVLRVGRRNREKELGSNRPVYVRCIIFNNSLRI